MKKILAFAGSNHSQSIHYKLLDYVKSTAPDQIEVLDIRKWDIPIYSIDMDPDGTPDLIKELISMIDKYDGFILASPEHNGGTPAFLKNILDWLSRRGSKVFAEKPLLLLSTSPGKGGGANNLKYLANALPYQGAKVVGSYSLPSYFDNYEKDQIVGTERDRLLGSIDLLKLAL